MEEKKQRKTLEKNNTKGQKKIKNEDKIGEGAKNEEDI